MPGGEGAGFDPNDQPKTTEHLVDQSGQRVDEVTDENAADVVYQIEERDTSEDTTSEISRGTEAPKDEIIAEAEGEKQKTEAIESLKKEYESLLQLHLRKAEISLKEKKLELEREELEAGKEGYHSKYKAELIYRDAGDMVSVERGKVGEAKNGFLDVHLERGTVQLSLDMFNTPPRADADIVLLKERSSTIGIQIDGVEVWFQTPLEREISFRETDLAEDKKRLPQEIAVLDELKDIPEFFIEPVREHLTREHPSDYRTFREASLIVEGVKETYRAAQFIRESGITFPPELGYGGRLDYIIREGFSTDKDIRGIYFDLIEEYLEQ